MASRRSSVFHCRCESSFPPLEKAGRSSDTKRSLRAIDSPSPLLNGVEHLLVLALHTTVHLPPPADPLRLVPTHHVPRPDPHHPHRSRHRLQQIQRVLQGTRGGVAAVSNRHRTTHTRHERAQQPTQRKRLPRTHAQLGEREVGSEVLAKTKVRNRLEEREDEQTPEGGKRGRERRRGQKQSQEERDGRHAEKRSRRDQKRIPNTRKDRPATTREGEGRRVVIALLWTCNDKYTLFFHMYK